LGCGDVLSGFLWEGDRPVASGSSTKKQPWDRRDWPERGDADKDNLYKCVGKALSAWEAIEAQLSYLFTQFISPGRDSRHLGGHMVLLEV